MKYFTKEMWRGWNSGDEAEQQRARELSDRNWQEYLQELEKLQSRLGPEAYEFFKTAERHDARLISFTAGDAINHDVHGPADFDINAHDTAVEIKLLSPHLNTLYTLNYSGVRKVVFDYPSNDPLFHYEGSNIADWGYDEVTAVDEKFLGHEVLFSSGTTILIEFTNFSFRQESS